jgi:chromosome segregation ATPase
MIEEKDNYSPYLAIEANQECHMNYIKELMTHISLVDFMEIHRQQQLNSQEMADMKKKNRDLTELLTETSEQHAKVVEKLQMELHDYKQTVEELTGGITVAELRAEINKAHRAYTIAQNTTLRTKEELTSLQWKHATLEKRYEELYKEGHTEEKSMRVLEMEEAYMKRIELLQERLRNEREKVATGKKESKTSEKKKAEKEKMKAELKVARAKAKQLAKQLSSSDSDSDSDE